MSEHKEVPIYIASPDSADDSADESTYIDPSTDPRKLLDHERPAQWEPYMPSVTLEQASKGETFRPSSAGSDKTGALVEEPSSAQPPPIDRPPHNPVPQPNRETNLPAAVTPKKPLLSSRVWLAIALTAINTFVLGVWIGSKYMPFETPKSSLDPVAPAASSAVNPSGVASGFLDKHHVADVAARAGRSVVNIDIRFQVRQPPSDVAAPLGGFKGLFGQEGQGSSQTAPRYIPTRVSEGTGLIVRSDGYILSNSHVVKSNSEIKVTLDDKRELKARFIGRDSFTDLAVIKVEGKDFPVAKFSTMANVRPGDWAIAIGSPLGFDHTVTLGIVSAIGRSLSDLMNHHVELIQTDVAINPGSSGGPLLNIDGEVIGIIAAIKSGAQNIAFAIPVDLARKITEDIIAHGTIARPYLGIFMIDDDPSATRSVTLPTHPIAVRVARVTSDGPCQKAGIMPGSIIEKVKGQPVKSTREVRAIISTLHPGDVVEFVLRRANGRGTDVKKVTVGFYPEDVMDMR